MSRSRLAAARALRIGVLHAGTIVEEETHPRRAAHHRRYLRPQIRWSFLLPTSPARLRSLAAVATGVSCTSPTWVTAECFVIASSQRSRPSGSASRTAARRRLRSTRHARGKLLFGDVTILFQMVALPAPTPRPKLPPSVRGGIVRPPGSGIRLWAGHDVGPCSGLCTLGSYARPRAQ